MRGAELSNDFDMLLGPGIIGKVETRNRIVLSPMVRNYATPEGFVTRQLIDHYASLARGGIGLIIVEATFVERSGKGFYQQLGIHDNRCITGLNELVDAVKEYGSRVSIQLHHAGRQTDMATSGMAVVAPSPIPCPVSEGSPKELTIGEINKLVEAFAQAARRAKQAGFDAVELHGAHGYLVNQFLSPNTNQRTDKYGGNLEGRATFLLEIISRTRELVGKDFAVTARINADDYVAGGMTITECQELARILEKVGIDALNITAGTYECMLDDRITSPFGMISTYAPRGQLIALAEQVKEVVNIPIITVGAITPEIGEKALRDGKADFIAMGRALIADPGLATKLRTGARRDIRPCIRCNEMCIGRLQSGLSVRCSVNAETSFESYPLLPTQKRKKILVIGGGPAGMEAARVSALRGHDVVLYEKCEELGGHLIEATVPSFKEDLRDYREWLIRQIKGLGIDTKTGQVITRNVVSDINPDVVIIATGSRQSLPDIPGIDKPVVKTSIDIMLGKAKPGNRNMIVGGGAIGCEMALYLALSGKKSIIVEMLPELAADVPGMAKGALLTALSDNQIDSLTNTRIIEIIDTGVIAINQNQNKLNLTGDRIIMAMGLVSQTELYEELKDIVSEIYLIGDCFEPRKVGEATRDGFRIASIL
jgi:2,4-dienoyl-CoA reductase-like NADH-dependent reductase (Old Yellow Enzyme family)/thioredoxin reductase